ncbi:hypothetical protein CF327_g3528 [Tilletia walkeri]|nr:hypothetical protein CF327_g3528 [Tilletia walkeri]
MFKTANPYDEPVTKATDENLTSEDWEANLDVCDKVSGEGEQGARNCIAAIQKRLAHRSANVQLYALILTDALSKNAGVNAHREIASRSFSQTLVRLATDRNTHDSVKRKAYSLVKEWTREYGTDPDLGIIQETYTALQKQLGHRFDEVAEEAAPEEPSTDELRREDEELRRVLELSMRDQGGRQHWASQYGVDGGAAGASGSSSGAGGAGAGSASNAAPASGSSRPAAAASSSSAAPLTAASASAGASRPGPSAPGFAPAAAPAANAQSATPAAPPAAAHQPARAPTVNVPATVPSISVIGASPATPVGAQPTAHSAAATAAAAAVASTRASAAAAAPEAAPAATPTVSRVRALYDFKASEQGELGFTKGDIIRVLYAVYDHWWRGELRGDVGIFPVNYVEILPDPTPADLQKEAEMEARVFDQAASIDSLLNKLKELDPARDNLADDEELQELYQVSLSMRPKIIRLIDRYSAKISELKAMNDKFVRARGTFDRLMEESLAKYNPGVQSAAYTQVRPEYTGAAVNGGAPGAEHHQQQQQYGYNNFLAQQQQQQQQQQQHPQLQQLQHQPQPAHLQGQQQPPAMQAQSVPPQQQQDYARAWAEWYAQNGYPEQAAQAAAAAAAAAAVVGQQGGAPAPAPSAVPAGPAGPITPFSGAGMAVPAPAAAGAPPGMLPPAGAPAAGGSSGSVALSQAPAVQAPAASPGPTTSAPLPTPSGSGGAGSADDVPRDVEKLRLYERARAETEAYQRQGGVVDPYGVYAGAGAGASGSGSGAEASGSGSGSGAMGSSSSAAAGPAAGPSQGSLV